MLFRTQQAARLRVLIRSNQIAQDYVVWRTAAEASRNLSYWNFVRLLFSATSASVLDVEGDSEDVLSSAVMSTLIDQHTTSDVKSLDHGPPLESFGSPFPAVPVAVEDPMRARSMERDTRSKSSVQIRDVVS